ncbi:3,4-dihydroxyphenylacetate 2,3-dioxygenase, partial [Rhodococcus fascians]|nr:3,4-dihydroxyphenylacetate 2,3-dioxygenase [Rhodococcus fascians]
MTITPDAPEPVVTRTRPIRSADPVPTPRATPPDVLRCAYMELVVTDLERSRKFYVDVLDLVVT